MNEGIMNRIKYQQQLLYLKRLKSQGKNYIGYILSKGMNLDDPNIIKYILDAIQEQKLTDNHLVSLITRGLNFESLLRVEVLYDRVVEYFKNQTESYISTGYNYTLDEVKDFFKRHLEDSDFVNRLKSKMDVQKIGDQFIENLIQERYTFSHSKERYELLTRLGYQVSEDKILEGVINTNAYYRERLYEGLAEIGLLTPTLVDRLYKYQFELIKQWCQSKDKQSVPDFSIPTYLEPSEDNKGARYWREMNIYLEVDALQMLAPFIKDYAQKHDAFGEKSVETIYQEWLKEHPYYDKPRVEFYAKFEENTGRLFDHDGIPKKLLFTNTYDLDTLGPILYYNHEGSKGRLNYHLIDFFVANLDLVPDEFKFIFKKIKELNGNRDAIEEFLAIITDNHYIHEGERLFDENGFNERFYNAILLSKNHQYLDVIEPLWREKFNVNELAYLEKYSEEFSSIVLYNIYEREKDEYRSQNPKTSYEELERLFPWLNIREKIARYFKDGKPNNKLVSWLLFDPYRRKTIENHEEYIEQLTPTEKGYFLFLKEIEFNSKIAFQKEEVNKYFDEKGAKLELCKYLFDLNEYDFVLITKLPYEKILDKKETLIIDEYKKIEDYTLQVVYKNYIKDNKDLISEDRIVLVRDVLNRISRSNSTEMITLRSQLANQLLATEDPLENLTKIEKVFLKNNMPTVGKIYKVFDILHPNFAGFNLGEESMISPLLKRRNNTIKHVIVFSDLLRASIGSNNRSLSNYLKSIKEGNELYLKLKNDPTYELTEEENQILNEFISHLYTMYENTLKGKENEIEPTGDYIKDIENIMKLISPTGDINYNLADRLVDMFCHFAGITTLEQAQKYLKEKISNADKRNRERTTIELKQGDFIKGIGGISYLGHILQNGSVSKEYLGAYSSSDATPLDTDLSMILEEGSTFGETINKTAASTYGPIWIALKQDDRFAFSRRSPEDPNQRIDEKYGITKLETFYTGVCGPGHYGIRTGFSSSDIDYIIVGSYDKRIGLEIAMNGFYIPVFNKEGKRVFTPTDYDLLREKMAGLSRYETGEYKFSKDLNVPGIESIVQQLPDSRKDIITKRQAIHKAIKKALEEFNLTLKYGFDGDLSEGSAELIDTGSTGRYTNMPGDGDFDFMMKLDKKVMLDSEKMSALKKALLKAFNKETTEPDEIIGSGDFRLKKVKLDDLPMTVDIDITFENKTDKIEYSTDESLKDRLSTIANQDREKYLLVVANILLAKKLLKKFEVYKPDRGEVPQGGLGGVGIENWILQNGGSLKTAAENFLSVAEGKTFEEFKASYVIWDFGENHLVTRKDIYPHDNFVYNMSESGYEKMKKVLKSYLKSLRELKQQEIPSIEEYISRTMK